jgi:hypothetical protein
MQNSICLDMEKNTVRSVTGTDCAQVHKRI